MTVFPRRRPGISTEPLSSKAEFDIFGGRMSPVVCGIEVIASSRLQYSTGFRPLHYCNCIIPLRRICDHLYWLGFIQNSRINTTSCYFNSERQIRSIQRRQSVSTARQFFWRCIDMSWLRQWQFRWCIWSTRRSINHCSTQPWCVIVRRRSMIISLRCYTRPLRVLDHIKYRVAVRLPLS